MSNPGDYMFHFALRDSSAIKEVSYSALHQELYITFKSGSKKYTYFDVPSEVVWKFIESESLGKGYHSIIKDKYSFTVANIIGVGEVG